jgi:hypothetical protein
MGKLELATQLRRDQVLASRALASRVHQAIHDGTGYVELRTRIEIGQVELVLVPTDRSGPLWLARAG